MNRVDESYRSQTVDKFQNPDSDLKMDGKLSRRIVIRERFIQKLIESFANYEKKPMLYKLFWNALWYLQNFSLNYLILILKSSKMMWAMSFANDSFTSELIYSGCVDKIWNLDLYLKVDKNAFGWVAICERFIQL